MTPDDVQALALPVLRHRVEVRAEAELEGVTADGVVTGVLGAVRLLGREDDGPSERKGWVPPSNDDDIVH